ncbi:MAG TPA: 3-dehydroquinate synthase [Deltaproteobacteria bacterium]|nr:3-dehydroquinate synthase [Deltaproteobacteria bacterium]
MIFLTGFMGSGKTTVGLELKKLLNRPFVDMDNMIRESSGRTIPHIFEYAGEESFRVMERKALAEITLKTEPHVVATGGALPADPLNRTLMKSCGVVIYLKTPFEELRHRIGADHNRPLWNADAHSLFLAREASYEEADITVDTSGKIPRAVAEEIQARLRKWREPVPVILSDRSYPVYIGRDIFKDFQELLSRHIEPEGIFALVDENVYRLHPERIENALKGCASCIMTVPSGESSKSYDFLTKVLHEMFSAGVNRQWLCLGIGGGVTGDLAGFAASIFMRGIPIAHVGTTLLAQVDSSIGGKTGINNEFGKNLVGTFNQPLLVLSDVNFLTTLEDVQIKSALAEVIKYGIIMDPALFEYIEKSPERDFEEIVSMCSKDKASVVSKDEREGGLRRILNFGHTLGHAIEQFTDFSIYHGQGVAAGILFASWLSLDIGILNRDGFERIRAVIEREGIIPPGIRLPKGDDLKGSILMDKKGTKQGIHFVLTPRIGDVTVKKLTDSEVLDSYTRFLDGF